MHANWVRQAVSAGGIGNLTLGSADAGFIDLNTAVGQGPRFKYAIEDGSNKEIGLGYLSAASTLVRETVIETLSSGTYDNTAPAAISVTTSAKVGIAPESGSLVGASPFVALDYDGNGYIMDAGYVSGATYGSLANRLAIMPFLLPCRAHVSGLACEVTTAAAGSIMLGIYQAISRTSLKKIAQLAAALDSGTTGVKTGNLAAAVTLNPGWWFVSMHTSAAPTVRSSYNALGAASAFPAATSYAGARHASATYADLLPDTLAASNFGNSGNSVPRILMVAP